MECDCIGKASQLLTLPGNFLPCPFPYVDITFVENNVSKCLTSDEELMLYLTIKVEKGNKY